MLEETVNSLRDLPGHFESVEGRLENVEGRLVDVEGRLVNVEGRLLNIEVRLVNVEGRLDTVELQIVQLRVEMRGEFSGVRQEMRDGTADLERRFAGHLLASEERTGRQLRILHEDVIAKIVLLAEGRRG